MKIYTGTGDGGKTSLFSGERILKSDYRIDAYGDVDELSSVLGVLIAHLPQKLIDQKSELQRIQATLFQMGAWLSTTPDSPMADQLSAVTLEPSQALEKAMDKMEGVLSPLKSFILPGGHKSAAFCHMARTVCRRAERHVVKFYRNEKMTDTFESQIQNIVIYLNRLSDYLFVLARYCNKLMHIIDIQWKN